jgi:chromosome segregation ATPase
MKDVVEQLKTIVANATKLIADRRAELTDAQSKLADTQTQLTTAIADNEQLKATDASLASELKTLLEALSSAVSNG